MIFSVISANHPPFLPRATELILTSTETTETKILHFVNRSH